MSTPRHSRRCGLSKRRVQIDLPSWAEAFLGNHAKVLDSLVERMRFVVELARRNIEHHTGGPFGAAVFEVETGRVVSVGVNLVETSNCSMAHAEMLALALAQQTLGTYDLGSGETVFELVTTAEPCAMCLGAIPWSGVGRVVCGARGEDAAAIGFDEGAKPDDWVDELRRRGIEVVCDVLREEARAVLQEYAALGGHIY